MTRKERQFWRREMEILDKIYKERIEEWQRYVDIYDLKFKDRIRDLEEKDLIKVSRFYPLVRQIIASIAFNYPKLFFAIEEEEGEGISEVMERAAQALFNLMDAKPHVHQAIFDALFCSVGWLRIDYNPPGDDMIAPYVTNDAMHEDLTALNRVPPGFVHLDPMTPPHKLGHARYIRERMWVPTKFLKDDTNIKNRREIKPTSAAKGDEVSWGDPMMNDSDDSVEKKAVRDAVENGEFVLVDRIHDRVNKKLIMFADGLDDEIMEIDHPFMKMSFPAMQDQLGNEIRDEEGEPVMDLSGGVKVPGWLVQNGFPFIPIKFDLHANSYYPKPHLAYVDDIQMGVVESLSRQANIMKRTARQGLMAESEALNRPELPDNLRKGVDGQWHLVQDPNNFHELNYGNVPADQVNLEDRLIAYEEGITRVTDLEQSGATPRTATEASLIGSQLAVNRDWMEVAVGKAYEDIVRGCFGVMGDPRYTPENFILNVAPNGKQTMSRALKNVDFLWNYRVQVVAGSTRPLFEQIEQDKFLNFYDRATQRPSFDQMELDKMLAASVDVVDVDRVIISDQNPEATQAAKMENEILVAQQKDPGVVEGQDHNAHMETHQGYQEQPFYQQVAQAAQQVGMDQQPLNPAAAQMLQTIDQVVQGHMQQHEEALQGEQIAVGAPNEPATTDSLQSTVRANAQNTANVVQGEAQEFS